MIENLLDSPPPHRHPALEQQRARLDRMIADLYPIPEDLALARIADSQGLGGSSAREGRSLAACGDGRPEPGNHIDQRADGNAFNLRRPEPPLTHGVARCARRTEALT